MDSLASSPAGRPSTQTGMHPPSANVAAARAVANKSAGKLGLTGIQTVMGNLEDIQFETEAEDVYDSVDGLQDAMSNDTVSSSQVQALLKLLATEAKKEVRSVAKAVETSVYCVIAEKDASVNDLKRSAAMLQQDKDDALAMVKRQKTNPSNVSSSERSFEFQKAQYDRVMGSVTDPKYTNLLPGDISHTGTDEATYADLLLQDATSEGEEKRMVLLDARIKIKDRRLKSMRLQIVRQISPTVTQAQMEKTKPTPFPLAQFAGVSTQTEWRTIVASWIKMPGNLNKYLEIAGDILMMYSAWDPAVVFYRCTGIQMIAPIWWVSIQQQGDPMSYLRATLSHTLFDEIVTLGAIHKAAAAALRQGLNVGFDGLTAMPWVEFDGLRSIHLALLSLRSVRSGDLIPGGPLN